MRIRKIMLLLVLSAVCVACPLYCLAQEMPVDVMETTPDDAEALIEEAKGYIEEGDKEGAVMTLDLAYDLAESLGDYDMLMEIGDLYAKLDPSLEEKAIKAWAAAGRCKTQE